MLYNFSSDRSHINHTEQRLLFFLYILLEIPTFSSKFLIELGVYCFVRKWLIFFTPSV